MCAPRHAAYAQAPYRLKFARSRLHRLAKLVHKESALCPKLADEHPYSRGAWKVFHALEGGLESQLCVVNTLNFPKLPVGTLVFKDTFE